MVDPYFTGSTSVLSFFFSFQCDIYFHITHFLFGSMQLFVEELFHRLFIHKDLLRPFHKFSFSFLKGLITIISITLVVKCL